MAEYLHYLLAVHHLLDESVHRAKVDLLTDEGRMKYLPDSLEKLEVTRSITTAVRMEITVRAGFRISMVTSVAVMEISELMI